MEGKITIGITHGDINGIGYEVILKTLADSHVFDLCTPVIYGSSKIAAFYRKHLEIQNLNLNVITSIAEASPKRINLINCCDDELKVDIGRSTEEAGRAAFAALERACDDLQSGALHALVTAPINKKNIQSGEFHFPGHTEYLQAKFGTGQDAVMLLASDRVRVAVATGHIPVKDVAATLTEELIVNKLAVLDAALRQDFGINRPRIAVLGLNPHAGDEGVIGTEEQQVIIPAIKRAVEQGIVCSGPYPADGFFGSDKYKSFDATLAMYHDQGLIPFKALSMDSGVNVTMGLNVVRTSPAHGTAYDLAGKNAASEQSFRQALYLAHDIYHKRIQEQALKANPLPASGKVGKGKDE